MRWAARWMDDAWQDTRYAARALARSRGFAVGAILTLAIGIGAATAIFSLVSTILLKPLPLHDADRLVRIVENQRPRGVSSITYREYLDWQARTTTLSDLAAVSTDAQVMDATDGMVRVTGGLVTPNYFEVLGARAMLGRTLETRDAATPDLIVLGFYAWQRHFRSDRGAIGSVVDFRSGRLAGRAMTVVGVMPESLETTGSSVDFYAPITAVASPGSISLGPVIGRLRDGQSLAVASEEANSLGIAIRPARPAAAPALTRPRFEAKSLSDGVLDAPPGRIGGNGPASPAVTLQIFGVAATVVLLIVCANVANLMLVRGTARRRELATRVALGASRGRLLRLILTESLILAAAGGTLGAALGAVGLSLIKQMLTVDAQGIFRIFFGDSILPRVNEVGIDLRLVGIAITIAAFTTIAFGLVPAFRLSRASQLEAIGSRGAGTGRRDTRLRMGLVVGQLAMATILLVGAGLLATSFTNLTTVDKGYDPTRVLTFQLVLPGEYPVARKTESIEAVLRATRALPEIDAAGFAYAGILIPIQNTVGSFVPPGRTLSSVSSETDRPRLRSISAGYLEAVAARLMAGRFFRETDSGRALPVAVINRAVQRRYFGDADPVGSFMDWHGAQGLPVPVQVIGVVADIRQSALDREPYPEIFMDYRQVIALQNAWGAQPGTVDALAIGFMSFAVSTRGDPAHAIPAVRQVIGSTDPNAALDAIAPLDTLVGNVVAKQRFYAVMLAGFAGIAALLAAIGIYGVLSYAVVERTKEIGLRMALGAGHRQVLRLVLSRGLLPAATGIAFGLAGAAAATRYLQAMLYGVAPLDRSTFLIVAVMFSGVAALASYLPARRATKVDPIVALRAD